MCENCGMIPGLHLPDGSCPLTMRTYQREQSEERAALMSPYTDPDFAEWQDEGGSD